jgi:hypothetical protein
LAVLSATVPCADRRDSKRSTWRDALYVRLNRAPGSKGHPSVISLWKFHLYPVSVSELIGITQPNFGGDLDDIPRVMSSPSFVLIRAQQERPAIENLAWNDAFLKLTQAA